MGRSLSAGGSKKIKLDLQRICITGVGVVSSIGIGRESFFAGLRQGRPNTGAIEGFRIEDYLASSKTYLDRCSAFTLAACALALKESEHDDDGSSFDSSGSKALPSAGGDALDTGICLGTAFGCLQTMEDFLGKVLEKGAKFANSLLFSHSYSNSPTSLAAIEFNLSGYHSTVTAGEDSGAAALVQAIDALRLGYADRMLAGGVDALSAPLLRVWSELYGQRMPGEGAAFFVLETYASLVSRGLQPEAFAQVQTEGVGGSEIHDRETPYVTEALLGFAGGAASALELAACLERVESGESNLVEIVSKGTGSARRIQVTKG